MASSAGGIGFYGIARKGFSPRLPAMAVPYLFAVMSIHEQDAYGNIT